MFQDVQWTKCAVEVTEAVETEARQNRELRKQTEYSNVSDVSNADPQQDDRDRLYLV
jgi:hypothetical protein